MPLTPTLQEVIGKVKPVDIVVGISTKNVDTTIVHVMNTAGHAISEFFPDYRGMVVVSDGFSSDRTFELANLFELPKDIPKIVTEQMGSQGKGNGVRTIFEIASEVDASAVVLVDGDLLSIRPEWIEHLGKPPIYGNADLVVPYYVRDKHDGVITNHIAYPLTEALHSVGIRQPICGEYGLSIECVRELLAHPLFPSDFGIDIFITTHAAVNKYVIQQSLLGLKLHESTTRYLSPGNHLIPMFRQVVGMMFELMEHYEDKWRSNHHPVEMRKVKARYHGQRPTPVTVDVRKFDDGFKNGYKNYWSFFDKTLDRELFVKLEEAAKKDLAYIEPELWAKLVYNLATVYKHPKNGYNKVQTIDCLRTLWMARVSSFVEDTEDLGVEETEMKLTEQAGIFKRELGYLESTY
ncbi:MAG: glycosyl transferase family 2 [Halobacteriota archaeon]|nr:glycosyl transferase family 2 [Halobacteriota archaeon]